MILVYNLASDKNDVNSSWVDWICKCDMQCTYIVITFAEFSTSLKFVWKLVSIKKIILNL